jgi:hypothetical protein
LQIDVDPDPVPDQAYHLDADPMRIQVTKMMRIRMQIHNFAFVTVQEQEGDLKSDLL